MAGRRTFLSIAMLSFLACVIASAQLASGPLKTTVCELSKDPLRFSGHDVQVRTTLKTNPEMSILYDPSCQDREGRPFFIWYGTGFVATDSSAFAFIDSLDDLKVPERINWLPPVQVAFHATKESQKVSEYLKKQNKKGGGKVEATFTGRFDYIPKWLALKGPDGKVVAHSAFGHQLCCEARLIPESVSDPVFPRRGR